MSMCRAEVGRCFTGTSFNLNSFRSALLRVNQATSLSREKVEPPVRSVGKLAKLLLMHLLADVVLDIRIADHNQSRHLQTSIYSRNRRQTTGAIQVSCLTVSSELFYAEISYLTCVPSTMLFLRFRMIEYVKCASASMVHGETTGVIGEDHATSVVIKHR